MGDLGDAYAAMSVMRPQKCPCGAQPQGHPSGLCDACVAKRIVDRPAPTPTTAPGLDLDAVERAERAMPAGEWIVRRFVDDTGNDAAAIIHRDTGETIATCDNMDRPDEAIPVSDAAGIAALRNAATALIAEVRALRAEVERLNSERPKIVETAREMRRERDAEIARLTAERDQAVAHRAATNEEIRRLHAVIKVKGFSVEDSIALHETRSEVARLTAELAAARAVPADVEAAIDAIECRGCGHGDPVTNADADRLRTAIARAISDATAARGTVGGLLATAPAVEYQVDLGRGPRWRQTRHGRTRTWLGSSPVGMSWTEWSTGSDDVDEYAARLVPAAEADLDPATRGPLPNLAAAYHPHRSDAP